jgi:hypothetical protein
MHLTAEYILDKSEAQVPYICFWLALTYRSPSLPNVLPSFYRNITNPRRALILCFGACVMWVYWIWCILDRQICAGIIYMTNKNLFSWTVHNFLFHFNLFLGYQPPSHLTSCVKSASVPSLLVLPNLCAPWIAWYADVVSTSSSCHLCVSNLVWTWPKETEYWIPAQ